MHKALDPVVLETVFTRYPEATLLTADDRMPEAHPVIIERLRATIATIEPWDRRPREALAVHETLAEEELWKREVAQRWVHEMAQQDRGSLWRYAEKRRKWTPNIRNPQGRLFKA